MALYHTTSVRQRGFSDSLPSSSKVIGKFSDFLSLIRVHQWHKNGFVLLGFFLLGDFDNYGLLSKAILNAVAFCLASSSVYIFNDYHDIDADRNHPLKRTRPLASGAIPAKPALVVAVVLLLGSLVISFYTTPLNLLIVAAYLANNSAYSLWLKKMAILDIFQIAFGFMLRIFAGTLGIGIYISEWMVITGFMISLLIGFSKRYAELSNHTNSSNHRAVLKSYSIETLRSYVIIMASATIMTYSLYTVSPRSIELHGTTNLIYTTPIVIFGVFRFLYLVMHSRGGEDPANQVLRDGQLIASIAVWALAYGYVIL